VRLRLARSRPVRVFVRRPGTVGVSAMLMPVIVRVSVVVMRVVVVVVVLVPVIVVVVLVPVIVVVRMTSMTSLAAPAHAPSTCCVRSMRTTAIAAPKPLSMFTTVTPEAQLESMPNMAVSPPSETP
jgi:hypothetical protein